MELKIMLVDDEPKVLRGLRSMIEHSGENWKITGEYKNGVEGLAAILNDCPDVVVTDIKMPCMDGLEMAERSAKAAPNLKFVILSGFADFTYAQQALRMGTADYILKPPNAMDIMNSLKRVHAQLEEEARLKQEQDELQRFRQVSSQLFQDQLFEELLYAQNPMETEIPDCFNRLYALFILEPDQGAFSVLREEDRLQEITAFRSRVRKTVARRGGCLADFCNGSFCCLINVGSGNTTHLKNTALELLEELFEKTEGPITVGVSRAFSGPLKVNEAFRECLFLMRDKVFHEKNSVLLFSERETPANTEHYPLDTEHRYIESLQYGDYEKSLAYLRQLLNQAVAVSHRESGAFREFLIEFVIVVMQQLLSDERTDKSRLPSVAKICKQLDTLDNIEDIQALLTQYTKTITDYYAERNKPGCRKVINDIKSYVNLHYFEEISLRQISSEFFMNESYLSDLFKREAGVSFSTYLTNLRIHQAKILLKQQDLKPNEIGEMVGYRNSGYFFRVFKKVTGSTPNAYREKVLNHG